MGKDLKFWQRGRISPTLVTLDVRSRLGLLVGIVKHRFIKCIDRIKKTEKVLLLTHVLLCSISSTKVYKEVFLYYSNLFYAAFH